MSPILCTVNSRIDTDVWARTHKQSQLCSRRVSCPLMNQSTMRSLWLKQCRKPVASSTFSILLSTPYCAVNSRPVSISGSPFHLYSLFVLKCKVFPLHCFFFLLFLCPLLFPPSLIICYSILFQCFTLLTFTLMAYVFDFVPGIRKWINKYYFHVCPLIFSLCPTEIITTPNVTTYFTV